VQKKTDTAPAKELQGRAYGNHALTGKPVRKQRGMSGSSGGEGTNAAEKTALAKDIS
jgi:hypothetical protein